MIVFLRLGCLAFGGPAAHIAMMQRLFVQELGWVTAAEFADLLGMTNLIPGPNSTEMALHLGYRRGGGRGMLLAGLGFIAPAALLMAGLAEVYRRWGRLPVFTGLKPVVMAVVAQAVLALTPAVVRNRKLYAVASLALIGSLLGGSELWLVLLPGLVLAAPRADRSLGVVAGLVLGMLGLATLVARLIPAGGPTPAALFLEFFKVGSVLYGSGYVLLAYLQTDLVQTLHWLSPGTLLDGVALGQATPGPVFTTAAFLGQLLAGWPGALAATVGIFLPSFALVPLSARLARHAERVRPFLDGVNAASLGLMTAVPIRLGPEALVDGRTTLLFLVSLGLLLRTRVSSAWLLAGAAALGWLWQP